MGVVPPSDEQAMQHIFGPVLHMDGINVMVVPIDVTGKGYESREKFPELALAEFIRCHDTVLNFHPFLAVALFCLPRINPEGWACGDVTTVCIILQQFSPSRTAFRPSCPASLAWHGRGVQQHMPLFRGACCSCWLFFLLLLRP
eukprot:TRINITY_DN25727_c0_g1_i1.p2 TRINITY_DN25727_c0_g1~~TRINITY_DN25727_c0_g1_i1.p2  ORF type:complete len:144 (+),score=9.54 TRINITY_DN25727_c0_g1_i1:33-464(+)